MTDVRRNPRFAAAMEKLAAGRSNRELARLTGVSHTTIGDMRWGTPPSYRIVDQFVRGVDWDASALEEVFVSAGYIPPPDLLPNWQMAETGKQAYWRIYSDRYQALEAEGITMFLPSEHPDTVDWDALTPEEAEMLVSNLERRSRERHASKQR